MDGKISDCSCEFDTVNNAVNNFFIPVLRNITARYFEFLVIINMFHIPMGLLQYSPFFRYFRVDLEKPCPFWSDEGGMCTNEGCSICPCAEDEIPRAWLMEQQHEIGTGGEGESLDDEYGWISRAGEKYSRTGGEANSGRLGKVSGTSREGRSHHASLHQELAIEGMPMMASCEVEYSTTATSLVYAF